MNKLKLASVTMLLFVLCACAGSTNKQYGRYLQIYNPLTQKVEAQITFPDSTICQTSRWAVSQSFGNEFSEMKKLFECNPTKTEEVLQFSSELRVAGTPHIIYVASKDGNFCEGFTTSMATNNNINIKEECTSK